MYPEILNIIKQKPKNIMRAFTILFTKKKTNIALSYVVI